MAMPLKTRAMMNWLRVLGRADRMADNAKRTAQKNNTRRRPNLSLKNPANKAPGTQP